MKFSTTFFACLTAIAVYNLIDIAFDLLLLRNNELVSITCPVTETIFNPLEPSHNYQQGKRSSEWIHDPLLCDICYQ